MKVTQLFDIETGDTVTLRNSGTGVHKTGIVSSIVKCTNVCIALWLEGEAFTSHHIPENSGAGRSRNYSIVSVTKAEPKNPDFPVRVNDVWNIGCTYWHATDTDYLKEGNSTCSIKTFKNFQKAYPDAKLKFRVEK